VSYTNVSGIQASYVGQAPTAAVEGRPQFRGNNRLLAEKNFGVFSKNENFHNADKGRPHV